MAQVGNSDNRFSGEYMVQDSDHMSDIRPVAQGKTGSGPRQSDQSATPTRQQDAGEQHAPVQSGGERHRKSR